jgi:hypothetical protein
MCGCHLGILHSVAECRGIHNGRLFLVDLLCTFVSYELTRDTVVSSRFTGGINCQMDFAYTYFHLQDSVRKTALVFRRHIYNTWTYCWLSLS